VFEDISAATTRSGRQFQMPSRSYLARFNFRGADQPEAVGSSRRRARALHLAKMLMSGANVVRLDEPSTTWTGDAARAGGGVLRIRRLGARHLSRPLVPRRIATHILRDEDTPWILFAGNYPGVTRPDTEEAPREKPQKQHRIRYRHSSNPGSDPVETAQGSDPEFAISPSGPDSRMASARPPPGTEQKKMNPLQSSRAQTRKR